jgi:hypothetical protein
MDDFYWNPPFNLYIIMYSTFAFMEESKELKGVKGVKTLL